MTYTKTHPWITFSVDMRRASHELWMLLGEGASKCEHISNVPLQPETATRMHKLYLAKGVLATTAIEGNTLTEEEVVRHLDGKLQLPVSKEYLAKEIDNVVAACNTITQNLGNGEDTRLSVEKLSQFNSQVLDGLVLEDGVVPGEIRKHRVVVGNVYRAPEANECTELLTRLCAWLNGPDFIPQSSKPHHKTIYAIIKSIIAHLYIAWIHPFGDGNGRTARLVEFMMLLSAGVPQPASHLLSNHYNQTRTRYYRELDAASKSGGNIMPFIEYAVEGFVDGLRQQLTEIRTQQWNVSWSDYVHERFANKNHPCDIRQMHLVLDLTGQQATPIAKIPELSARLAKEYAKKTPRTLARDVNALEKMGLITKTKEGIKANPEIIIAFLPFRNRPI